ncbi:MAG: hypothetical protein K2W95_35760 [Candidatus Obscuribacterales bacterium]|nr:hypothetical protein [Candidatus Obscuribacterales bacterium]
MACNSFYIDDEGQVWLGQLTRPDHTDHVALSSPPRRAPGKWTQFLKKAKMKDLSMAYPVLPPPDGWTPASGTDSV